MASAKTILYYGALLHDVGKVIYRETGADEAHFKLGADFISGEIAAQNDCFASDDGQRVIEQIRYQKKDELAMAELPDDSLAYITWFANGVSSQTGIRAEDERQKKTDGHDSANRAMKLRKIFNHLNGRDDDGTVEHEDYSVIKATLREGLASIDISSRGVVALLNLLESTVDAVPAQTNMAGLVDVSLYDHMKTTASIAACVYECLQERGIDNYREALFDDGGAAHARGDKMFLLYSCDLSGIQDFIYTISGSGALKQLRARSMYLELLLEHIVDELLERLGLNRANLLYTGGGHAYLLLPNTAGVMEALRTYGDELREWFVSQYRNDLFVASASVSCSADDLINKGDDKRRYSMLFRQLSRDLSESKAARYNAAIIRRLNFDAKAHFDHGRECSECHRSDVKIKMIEKTGEDRCGLCAALGEISKHLVQKDVFVVERGDSQHVASNGYATLALPFDCRLSMLTLEEYRSRKPGARRVYTKGEWSAADGPATRIWMGDYTADTQDKGIEAYALQGATLQSTQDGQQLGIQRLGVLRADVDDLGAAFASGLPGSKMCIGRSSALSRSLGFFFKSEINDVLRRGGYQAQIIYSGGDDLFIIGNWNDVIYAAVDVRNAFDKYTGNGSLTLSGGIGMFARTYPIARMASEVGNLEDAAKHYVSSDKRETKNAVALWSDDAVFGWKEFAEVIVPRMQEVRRMFEHNQKGNAFVYRLVALLRDYDSAASAPRLAYLLARSFEDDRQHGREACNQLYAWAQDPQERRRLITALEWYVYSIRKDVAHE